MDDILLHIATLEEWRPVKGFENYLVSSHGRIYSKSRFVTNRSGIWFRKGKFKTPQKRKRHSDYLSVRLFNDSGNSYMFVHRIVAEAFIPNKDNFPFINHKDGNPLNNKVDNLEWCDAGYNNIYGNRISKSIKSRIESGNTRIVIKFSKDGKFIGRFDSYYEAARSVEKPKGAGNICKCCQGERAFAYGFIWKHEEDCSC